MFDRDFSGGKGGRPPHFSRLITLITYIAAAMVSFAYSSLVQNYCDENSTLMNMLLFEFAVGFAFFEVMKKIGWSSCL